MSDETNVPTAELRSLLERTGHLYTQQPEDVWHVSERWRKEIVALLEAIDGGTPIGKPQPEPYAPDAEVARMAAAVRRVLVDDVEAKYARAVWLVEEALPRMRSLSNAVSARWLPVAEAFLADGSVIRL